MRRNAGKAGFGVCGQPGQAGLAATPGIHAPAPACGGSALA
jgi:hypothetical protein